MTTSRAPRSLPALDRALAGLAADPRLDRVRPALQRLADAVAPAGPRGDLLRGEPLGQPLHPVLVDLPIGFWTSAAVLDVIGGRRARPAAQRLVGLGILSAIPSALAGWAEWADADEGSQRVGVVHAGLGGAAVAAYVLSWRHRRRGAHLRGVVLGVVGAGLASAGGHVGGHLAYVRGVGQRGVLVDGPQVVDAFVPDVVAAEEGPSDGTTLVEVLAAYEAAGFDAAFVLREAGTITCRTCGTTSSAADFSLQSLRRLEGASDPSDMVAVAAVHCPSCGVGGTLVLRYGPEAGEDETLVYLALDDRRADSDGLPAAAAPGEAD